MSDSEPLLVNVQNNEIYHFNGESSFTVGRSVDCSLDLPYKSISRNQCKIELTDNHWEITDLSRFKSTRVNDEQVLGSTVLHDGDRISFHYTGLQYVFFSDGSHLQSNPKRIKLDKDANLNKNSVSVQLQESPSTSCETQESDDAINKLKTENESLKRNLMEIEDKYNQNECSITLLEVEKKKLKHDKEALMNEMAKIEAKLKKVEEVSDAKQILLENKIDVLGIELNEAENISKKYCEQIVEAETEINCLLEERCCKILNYCSNGKFKDVNSTSEGQTNVEVVMLQDELKEMTKKFEDHDRLLSTFIEEKSKMSDILETELYCSVCSEMIFQAKTLNCRHTFCTYCIDQWKKSKRECPICRTKIKTEVDSLMIDSLIDKVAETFGGDMKKRREEVRTLRLSKQRTLKASTRRQSKLVRRARGGNIDGRNRRWEDDPMIDLTDLLSQLDYSRASFMPNFIDLTTPNSTNRGRAVNRRRNHR